MGLFRRSSLVFDLGFSQRAPLTQFLTYWDGDKLGRHQEDKKWLKSFQNPNSRPWIVFETFVEQIGQDKKELLIMGPVCSTPVNPDKPDEKVPFIRGHECFQLYRNFHGGFPKKDTCIRHMMVTVATVDEVKPGRTFDDFGGDPIYLDNYDWWPDFETYFLNAFWTAERLAMRMRERLGALKHQASGDGKKKDPSQGSLQPVK